MSVKQSFPNATAAAVVARQQQWRHSNSSSGGGGVPSAESAKGATVAGRTSGV